MSPAAAARQYFEALPEDARRAILEGRPTRMYAVRASVVQDGGGFAWAIDTLPRDGRSAEWERVTRKIARIMKQEVERIDRATVQALKVIAAVTAEDLEIFQADAWVSMDDDGGSLWTVTVSVYLAAAALPAVVKASERTKKQVLKVVCSL